MSNKSQKKVKKPKPEKLEQPIKPEEKKPLPALPETEKTTAKKTDPPESSSESLNESSRPGIDQDPEEILDQLDIIEICKDLSGLPFEIWHVVNPDIEELTEKEKRRIGRPLARIAQKHDFARIMKDEFLLLLCVGVSISKRVKIKKPVKKEAKKNVKIDNRKTGPR